MNNLKNIYKQKIVLFSLDEPRYALYLSAVERVVQAVEITPLPKAPKIIMGVINFHGEIIPVIDIRKRFHLISREINLEDQFIIAQTSKRTVVLVVDSVEGVYDFEQDQVVDAEEVFPYVDYISGVAKIETDIVLINDLEKFLSIDEEKILDQALLRRVE
jgi:purine-binding chemotaxis protein CheW